VRGGAALWVLFTVVAVGAGLAAASSVGSAISDAGSQPRSDAQIRAALGAAATSPRAGVSPTATPASGGGRPHQHDSHRPHASASPGTGTGGGPGATTAPSSTQRPSHPGPTSSTPTGGGQHDGSGGPTGGTGGGQGGTEQRATLSSSAGTVVASCTNDNVTLLTWSPALGYRVNEVHRGPSREAEITFAGDSHADVTMVVTCGSDGRPRATVETDSGSDGR
jgi:hypothetical protein